MTQQNQTSLRGEQFIFTGLVTKGGVGYPAGSVAGFTLRFAAKRKKTDAAAVITKDTGANPTDVTLAVGGAYTVRILQADTGGFTVAELLSYEIVLVEPDATLTVVDYGTWKVGLR